MTTTISNFHPFFIPQPPSKFGGEILTENSEFSIFCLEIFLSRWYLIGLQDRRLSLPKSLPSSICCPIAPYLQSHLSKRWSMLSSIFTVASICPGSLPHSSFIHALSPGWNFAISKSQPLVNTLLKSCMFREAFYNYSPLFLNVYGT